MAEPEIEILDRKGGKQLLELYVLSVSSDVKKKATSLWTSFVSTVLVGICMKRFFIEWEQSVTTMMITLFLVTSQLVATLYGQSDDQKLMDVDKIFMSRISKKNRTHTADPTDEEFAELNKQADYWQSWKKIIYSQPVKMCRTLIHYAFLFEIILSAYLFFFKP
uniref:Neur_chan_memb domain-containing protein n=1 Tax=Caenorhabditis tropicalis TaxID=1561998 RepID=A0A1I7TPP4_9PELO